jgi:hypothetical protein
MKMMLISLGLLGMAGASVANQNDFTGDAEAVQAMVAPENGINKMLSGHILSIKKLSVSVLPSEDGTLQSETRQFEIQAEDANRFDGKPRRVCTLRVTVISRRDKMVLVGTPVVTPANPICK